VVRRGYDRKILSITIIITSADPNVIGGSTIALLMSSLNVQVEIVKAENFFATGDEGRACTFEDEIRPGNGISPEKKGTTGTIGGVVKFTRAFPEEPEDPGFKFDHPLPVFTSTDNFRISSPGIRHLDVRYHAKESNSY
jgi:hypothetical protein